jgi:signal transduction histidine kinase
MALSLRHRILLTLAPLLALLAALGAGGAVLLYRLGGRVDLILRENYVSVIAMRDLNEALERIDSSFQFSLAGRADKGRPQYESNWPPYRAALATEQANITLPGEAELVARLTALTERYRRQGEAFYALPWAQPAAAAAAGPAPLGGLPPLGLALDEDLARRHYFDPGGLLDTFREIKQVSGDITRINQDNMEEASRDARETARRSLAWFGAGLAAAALLAGLTAWQMVRAVLRPVRAVTDAALAVGAGNLNQAVPAVARDELGQLASAFNQMAARLRDYRQSHSALLLRAQRTAQATIDSFPDPVLVVEPEGRVEMANPAARRVLGVAPAGPGGPDGPPWRPPEPLRQPLADALQQQRPYLAESFAQAVTFRLGGEDHAYLPQVLPIRDPYGFTLGAAVVLQDVTRFRLLDQLKSDLVATVSHELKTPLTSVRLVLHLLLEEATGPLTPKQAELLVDARDNAERLLGIIENLLALARLERGQELLTFGPVAPADLLRAAADAARPRAEAKRVELAVEAAPDTPDVAADPHRFGHALNNLVENALAYTDEGGRVTLSARPDGAGGVVLSVSDTGAGIPAEHLPRVFDRFFRVPGRSRGQGTGLGLAIVREIVSAHRGTVACASAPGQGTTFTITLPAWDPRGEGPAPAPSAAAAARGDGA